MNCLPGKIILTFASINAALEEISTAKLWTSKKLVLETSSSPCIVRKTVRKANKGVLAAECSLRGFTYLISDLHGRSSVFSLKMSALASVFRTAYAICKG